ncbi:hypothetical protein MKW94_024989 [Papaver nudicaule]|uniref:Uncharacterized protein n=1 Tax=Papaver nudicaule TaxID=74823 RepID=A0AA41V1Z7_PAPNU|nr:hypothetical protein [Papaver nudicaule]
MAPLKMFHQTYSNFFTFLLFLVRYCSCFNPKLLNASLIATESAGFSSAGATWYGDPNGFGSDGGACGYAKDVKEPLFSSRISAGGASLFNDGQGCDPRCSGKPVTVVITDSCPGKGTCAAEATHFDLSGTAFGAMANPGQEQQLRDVGTLQIQYQRVKCNFPSKIVFKVDAGSNPNYFATLVEYQNTDSDIVSVDLQAAGSSNWQPMQRRKGTAVWVLNSQATPLKTPFSLRLRSGNGKMIVAQNVIPDGYQPNNPYESKVNF